MGTNGVVLSKEQLFCSIEAISKASFHLGQTLVWGNCVKNKEGEGW